MVTKQFRENFRLTAFSMFNTETIAELIKVKQAEQKL